MFISLNSENSFLSIKKFINGLNSDNSLYFSLFQESKKFFNRFPSILKVIIIYTDDARFSKERLDNLSSYMVFEIDDDNRSSKIKEYLINEKK